MASSTPLYYTADMVRALNEAERGPTRYETVWGELLVSPAPRPLHQLVLRRLVVALDAYLSREPVGVVFASPADISWAPDELVQPDVFVVDVVQARTLDWPRMQRLLFAAEALSPSSIRADRFTKRKLYQTRGVGTYWILDADARAVEIWTPEDLLPRVLYAGAGEVARWQPSGATTELAIALSDLFAPV